MSAILLPEPTGSMLSQAGSSSRPTFTTKSVAWIGVRIASWIMRAVRETQFRRAARELHRLDDRMLRDIGVTRSEIDAIVRDNLDSDHATMRAVFGLPLHRAD